MKDSTFLTRWGHTSTVYENKIYVYGGRFCNDLSDILMLDPEKNTITNVKFQGEAPKARRRHSACFLGSSMLIFGGFNGEYFNDLHYINVYSTKKKVDNLSPLTVDRVEKLSNITGIKTF
jgi:N-acetylneuraminic acid mutarotase